MVLLRLRFFGRGFTAAVFRFGQVPERSEVFTTSKTSASKQFTLLKKKDVGSVSREQVDNLRCSTIFSKTFAINFFKNRHGHFFFKLRLNLCDLCVTRRYANFLSDIIDLLTKE